MNSDILRGMLEQVRLTRVYLGSQSIIALGMRIGSMVVIAANSFVRGIVPTRSIVAGVPAVPIGHVEGGGESVPLVFERGDAPAQ
jgi:serine acetyltransferase